MQVSTAAEVALAYITLRGTQARLAITTAASYIGAQWMDVPYLFDPLINLLLLLGFFLAQRLMSARRTAAHR